MTDPNAPDEPSLALIGAPRLDPFRLMNDPPAPIPWAIEGLLAEQDIAIISGKGGIGKTYILMELAIALSRQRPLFGYFPVARPYKVMYVDCEMASHATSLRFHRMLRGEAADGSELESDLATRLHIVPNGSVLLDEPQRASALLSYVRFHKIDFILIDSIIRTISGDENASQTANALLRNARAFRAAGAGFVFLGHWRKQSDPMIAPDPSEMLRGSSAWRDILDVHHAILPAGKPDTLRFVPDKSRHVESLAKFDIAWQHDDREDDTGPFRIRFVPASDQTEKEKELLALLTRAGDWIAGPEIEKLTHWPTATRKRILKGLVDRGLVDTTGAARSTRYRIVIPPQK